MKRVSILLAAACAAVFLLAGSARASQTCDQMREWVTRDFRALPELPY